jgi:type I restriction enzyme S subunit
MEKYDSYKSSGVEWIGEIPSRWAAKRLKFLAKVKTGYTPLTSKQDNFCEDGVVWAKPDDLNTYNPINSSKERISTKGLKLENLVLKGSVLVCCIGSIGKFGVAGVDLVTNQQINSLSFNELIYSEFGKYLVGASQEEHDKKANGNVVKILNTTSQKEIFLPVPPFSEQTAIATFLDQKTAQIDRAIAQKERLIELLRERKQIVIQQAVTRGLDPTVKMKDSGVEWIDRIPAHWEIKKLKHLTSKIGSGVTPSGGGTTYLDDGVPLLRSQNIHFGSIDLIGAAKISLDTHHSMSNSNVRKGDVLLNITGGSIGRCHYVEDDSEINVNQHVCIVRPVSMVETEFLNAILASEIGQAQIWFYQQGGGREGLNFQNLKNFYVPLPCPNEQQNIVRHLKKTSSKLDQTIQLQSHQIDRLKEYRTVLIDAAVTGKIKVM